MKLDNLKTLLCRFGVLVTLVFASLADAAYWFGGAAPKSVDFWGEQHASGLKVKGVLRYSQLNVGQALELAVDVWQSAGQRAYVAVVKIDDQGRVAILYPSSQRPYSTLQGAGRLMINEFRQPQTTVFSQAGQQKLQILASTDLQLLQAAVSDLMFGRGSPATLFSSNWQSANIAIAADAVIYHVGQPVQWEPSVTPEQPADWSDLIGGDRGSYLRTGAGVNARYYLNQLQSDFHLGLSLANGYAQVNRGAPLAFSILSEKDCDLGLIHVSPRGEMAVVYPNVLHRQVLVEAGSNFWLPGSDSDLQIKSDEPGTNGYIAVCERPENTWGRWYDTGSTTAQATNARVKPAATIDELLSRSAGKQKAFAFIEINVY